MRRNSIPTLARVSSPILLGAALAGPTFAAGPADNAGGAPSQTSRQLQQEIQDLRERLKALEAASQPANSAPVDGGHDIERRKKDEQHDRYNQCN